MEKKLDFSFKEHAEQPQKRFKGNSPKFGQVDSLELDESSKPDASKPVDKSQGNESEPTPSREPAYDLASNSPETDELDDWTSDSSQSVYDLCARSSGSASIRSAATRKTTFSRANTKDVELMLNIERGEITRMKTKLKQPTAKELIGQELFKEAANELLNEVFRRLRISLNTKPFPNDGISEAIRSFHFGNILEPINIHFLEQFDIEKEELEFVPEWPIDWQGYSGRMDYAVFRTGQKALEVKQWKQVNKRYFFVVEMKADNALDGLKQAIMYLKKLQEKDNGNLKTYYAILSNALDWHLLKLDHSGLRVSEQHRVLGADLEGKLDEKREESVREEWKKVCGLLVHTIFSILQQGLASVERDCKEAK